MINTCNYLHIYLQMIYVECMNVADDKNEGYLWSN